VKIGVVGTGRMGANIARRLHDACYQVARLYDVRAESAAALAGELGSTATTSLRDVARESEVILTVVTDDAAMRQIFAPHGDSLLSEARGKLFLNCATVSPRVHVEIERSVGEKGGDALEACMASSIAQAREGTLYLMIGGSRAAFERVKPLLEKMSASLIYVGEAGRAAQVKALVNMVMNVNTAGLAEGLGLGEALGLELDMLRTVFAQTGANSRVLETDGADMQNREHDVFFSAAHAAKDCGIALELARDAQLDLPLAKAAFAQFERMKELGLGELDKSGIAELTFKSRKGGG
jgi:3-hydroxyisobutyrate dehydrogenase